MSMATNTVVMSIKVKNHSLEQRLHFTKLHSMWDIRNDNSAWILVRKTWFSEKKYLKKYLTIVVLLLNQLLFFAI